jgi:hypothetical protein
MSNLDSVIFGLPLLGLMLSTFFRMEELVVRPVRCVARRHRISGLDCCGRPICLDPDGTAPCGIRRARRNAER